MSNSLRRLPGPIAITAILLGPALVLAQDEPVEFTPPGNWVFGTTLGAGQASGGYGDFLEKPVNFDLNIGRDVGGGAWRVGFGIQFGSMEMKPPYDDEEEWARFDTYLYANRTFNRSGKVRPYLQGRVGIARIHPRSELFWFDDPHNLEPGASPTKWANGVSFTFQPGVEIELAKGFALDVSGWWTGYRTGDYSTVPPMGPVDPPVSEKDPVNSGQEYGLKFGVQWRPVAKGVPVMPEPRTDPATGILASLPPPDAYRDAWGVPRSWGWATGEMLGINFGASMFNEYVRQANFNQISPRSWVDNFKTGWTFDDNEFATNQLIHPFNGATYFNAARSNGLSFWQSSIMANAGAFVWECCGETHPMSWNDMISTGIGGMARGEWAYRISSLIIDNTKTGGTRILREIAAGPFNPIRTFNRFVAGGRATRVQGNPADPYDWRPPYLGLQLYAGARVIGEGESITNNTNYYGFLEGTLQFGSAFYNERRKPFDRFDTSMQLNFGEKTRVGQLTIRGDLASWKLGEDKDNPKHVFAITQDFDYVDNEAYEYGGQFFGGSLFSGFGTLEGTRLVTRLTGYVSPMAAVNADYSFLGDVANRERFREYDYGPGIGAGFEAVAARKGRPFLALSYRYAYISVRNGSIWNPDNPVELPLPDGTDEIELEGSDANHHVHRFGLRLLIPFGDTWGMGADGRIFYRDSTYTDPRLLDKTQRVPEVRVYLTWDLGYTKKRIRRDQRAATAQE